MSKKDTKIISIINMKGGVSKTTLCKEIGFHLSHVKGKKVLLVDIDPQANLTQSMFRKFGYKAKGEIQTAGNQTYEETEKSISYLFTNGKTKKFNKDKVTLKLTDSLDLIPGTLGTDFVARKINSADMEQSLYNYFYYNEESGMHEYDYILFDCPPTYSEYTVAAMLPSHYYLIPVNPDSYSVLGIQMLEKVIKHIESNNPIYFQNKKLKNMGVVFTKIARKPEKGVLDLIENIKKSERLKKLGITFFESPFRINSKLTKEMDYLIDLGGSNLSKVNLEVIVSELEGRL
ncbi:ParA family protein [Bacillus mycoides]|uniref:ParA family protein n=1 Tax=Bacillus mycoides TaxID=1405 RepID=UPI0024BDD261|nr:ParA family protein [Bacillus mycoides]